VETPTAVEPSAGGAQRPARDRSGPDPRRRAGDDQTAAVRERIDGLIDATWAFSALSAAVELGLLTGLDSARTPAELSRNAGASEALASALLDVLASIGLVRREGPGYAGAPEVTAFLTASPREDLLARLRSAHFQSRAMVDAARRGTLRPGWIHTDPELLQAQGRSGRASTHAMAQIFSHLPGLQERLTSPGATFLDVGMGVGVISIEMCRLYPHLRVVGLEPGAVPAQEARRNAAAAGLEDRIEVREQRLEDLEDREAYDFAYLAQVFMPIDVVKPGLRSLRMALRPGGYISMAAIDAPGDDPPASTARLLNVLWGGTPVDLEELVRLTRDAGFEMVQAGGEPGRLVKGIAGRRPLRDG
jgi:2-polyprenyl-3-methyl-5-hydroxy-6-metoxy-1,4-benzoquinol methylase